MMGVAILASCVACAWEAQSTMCVVCGGTHAMLVGPRPAAVALGPGCRELPSVE